MKWGDQVMRKLSMGRLLVGAAATLSILGVAQTTAAAAPPDGTNTAAAEAAACASLYGVSAAVGPDSLSACQWDMRAIGATSAGSYAVNRGQGARIGDIDTGIDLTNSVCAHRRPLELLQLHMRQLIAAGCIEGRIGKEAKAVDFNQGGGAADQGDREGHAFCSFTNGFAASAGRVTR